MSDDGSKKWRCAWCGKPHERNDPPCDECGHHKLEKAVVPVAPDDPDHTPEPVWVCPECGREHQKNTPPCSRCGNATLEKHTPDYSDLDDLGAPSYVDLLEPRYVAGVVLALAAGAVLVLGVLGVGPLAGINSPDLTVTDVPGSDEEWNGLSLAEVESAYVAELNDRRAEGDALERAEGVDDVARFYNQRRVKTVYANGSLPSERELRDAVSNVCDDSPALVRYDAAGNGYDSEAAAASALLDVAPDGTMRVDGSRVGVDVHVGPDGRVFVTQLAC